MNTRNPAVPELIVDYVALGRLCASIRPSEALIVSDDVAELFPSLIQGLQARVISTSLMGPQYMATIPASELEPRITGNFHLGFRVERILGEQFEPGFPATTVLR